MIVAELLTSLGFKVDTSQLNNYDRTLKESAQKAVAVGAGMAAMLMGSFLKISADTFGKFEAQLNQTAAVSGATEAELAKLEKQALKLGSSTKFSASETAEAQSELSKAGMNVNQVLTATPGILSLAAAGGMAVGRAAEIASGTLNAFGLEAAKAGDVSDIFAKAANLSAIGLEDIGETVKYAAPAFRAAGQSIQDFSTLTAIMGNNMIKGSMAGTSLAGGMARLTSPPKQAAEALEKWNITTHDAQGNMLNIVDLLIQMKHKFKDATQQEKSAALTKIFGLEAAKGFLAVLNTEEKEIRRVQKEMHNYTGAAAEMAAKMNSGLLPALDELKGVFETLFIVIGKKLAPKIISVANGIGELVNKINNLSPKMHEFIGNALIAGTAFSGLLVAMIALKFALPVLANVKNMLLSIQLATIKMWLPWLAGAAIIVGLILLIQDLFTMANGGDSIIGKMLKPFPEIKKFLVSAVEWFRHLMRVAVAMFQMIGEQFLEAYEIIKPHLDTLYLAFSFVSALVLTLAGTFIVLATMAVVGLAQIIVWLVKLSAYIVSWTLTILDAFSKIASAIAVFFGGIFSSIYNALQGFISVLIQAFTKAFSGDIPGVISDIIDYVGGILTSLQNLFSTAIDNIVSFFTSAFTGTIPNLIGRIGGMLGNLGNLIGGPGGLNVNASALGGGANNTNFGNINNTVQVQVAGTNASASDIAKAASNGTGNALNQGLANASRNAPRPSR